MKDERSDMGDHRIRPGEMPATIQSALESLLGDFARTRARQLDHPDFGVFTEWCRSQAEDWHLLEPSSNTLELLSLEALSATDSDLLDAEEVTTADEITDRKRVDYMAARFDGLFESEDPQWTPADLILCKNDSSGTAYLGYYVSGDYWDSPSSIKWEGFFESPDAYRRWWRGREYFTLLEEFLELTLEEKLKYWVK
jgi:hypothetical protein